MKKHPLKKYFFYTVLSMLLFSLYQTVFASDRFPTQHYGGNKAASIHFFGPCPNNYPMIVFIDGVPVAEIPYEEAVKVRVAPGKHIVWAYGFSQLSGLMQAIPTVIEVKESEQCFMDWKILSTFRMSRCSEADFKRMIQLADDREKRKDLGGR